MNLKKMLRVSIKRDCERPRDRKRQTACQNKMWKLTREKSQNKETKILGRNLTHTKKE